MAKTLGLDLGTNSIGWALVDLSEKMSHIIDKGVRVFDEGVKIEKGNEISRAAERTKFRSARRIKYRRKVRKINTLKVLIEQKMCPLSYEELIGWKGNKDKYPTNPEFRNWLKSGNLHINQEKSLFNHNPYYLRAIAVERKIEPYQLGRALYHLAQRRGFLSNRLDIEEETEGKNDEKSLMKKQINEITVAKKDKTLGQYFYELQKSGEKVRGKHTAREEHYIEEFHKICKVQQIDDTLKQKLYDAIFYQRPLKSQKGNVGKCSLEKNKPRCPVSHPAFEEFRALQFINSIKIIEEDRFLTAEERKKIWPKFVRKSKQVFQFKEIKKELTPKGITLNFNYKDFVNVSGCPTIAGLVNIFGIEWKKEICDRYNKKETKLGLKTEEQIINDVWHALFNTIDENKLTHWAMDKLRLEESKAKAFAGIKIKKEYSSLSLKAINKIIPHLRDGHIYSFAVFLANIDEIVGNEIWQNTEKQLYIKQKVKEIIDNDNVQRKTYMVVNELIARHNEAIKQKNTFEFTSELIQQKIDSVFGRSLLEKFTDDRRKKLNDEIHLLFDKQISKFKAEFLKIQRLDEKIKTFLIDEFGVSEVDADKLYHPSAIELFKSGEISEDGKLYLGSPRVASIKNPVVMRTLHELRKLINELIKNNIIDENTRINIELARELNDSNKRAAIHKYQRERESLKKEFADKLKDLYEKETGIKIEPNEDDLLKYELWEEQKHKCLYTGKTIGITEFIGPNPKYDIEHTIPVSVSFDDSNKNLTLCELNYNRNVKKNRLPAELPDHTKILERISHWDEKISYFEKKFNDRKKPRGFESKEQRNNRIIGKHYFKMHYDYWREKKARFEMNEVTAGFKNSQLIDTGIITRYAMAYLKSVFEKVYAVKGEAVEKFRKAWGLQEEHTQKERISHLHHCIDAVTIACMSKDRYDLLAKYLHADEENNHAEVHNLLRTLKPWSNFVQDVKSIENEVLVSHQRIDNLLKQTKKRLRIRGKIQKTEDGKIIYQQGDTARGPLHQDTFYGAISKRNEEGAEEIKYVVRKELSKIEKESDIDKVIDPIVKQKILSAVEEKGLKKAISEPIWMNDAKKIPIKKVRVFTPHVVDPIKLKLQRDTSPYEYKQYYNVTNEANYLMAIYEGEDNNGRIKRDFELVNYLTAATHFKLSNKENREPLYPQKKFKYIGTDREFILPIMKRNGKDVVFKVGDLVLLCEDSELNLDRQDTEELSKRLFKIKGLSHSLIQRKYDYGIIVLLHHSEARPVSELKIADGEFRLEDGKIFRKLNHNQINALISGIDFELSPAGKIIFY